MHPPGSSPRFFPLVGPQRRFRHTLRLVASALGFALCGAAPAPANVAGGGDGTGPNVTITEKDKWIILSNGICTINITKASPRLDALDYTFNNNGSVRTAPTLKGRSNKRRWFRGLLEQEGTTAVLLAASAHLL